MPRDDYWIGVDAPGRYVKLIDSDDPRYGGSGYCRATEFDAAAAGTQGRPHALRLALPPLGALILRRG